MRWLSPFLAVACGSTPEQPAEDGGSTTDASATMVTTSVGTSTTSVDDTTGTGNTSATADDASSADDDGSGSSESGTLDEPVDAIIDAMRPNSWVGLPATAMADVCPEPYDSYNCESVMLAWSGAAYDHGRDRMIVWGGGHADSYYNNVFVFDLGPMTWTRLTELPEGANGDAPTQAMLDSRVETCGYYPSVDALEIDEADLVGAYLDPDVCHRPDIEAQLDLQQPRSSHSYGKPAYMPTVDAFLYLGGGYFPGAQSTSPWGFRYSFTDGTWSETARRPGFMGRGIAAVDAVGDVWYASDDTGRFARYRPDDDAWDTYGSLNYDIRGVGDIDRSRNQFWVLQDESQDVLLRGFDLDDEASLNAADPFTDIETTGEVPPQGNRVGFVYADDLDLFAAWVGGRDVYTLDPATRVWTHHVGTGDEPTPPAGNGTYGRWRYSTKRNVFVLVNDTTGGVFIYKPEA